MKVYDLNIALLQPETVTELYLTKRKFDEFPVRILGMKNLVVLDLSSCKLVQIPEEIANLEKLHTLILNDNAVRRLPNSIARLPLRVVSLETNALTAIPEVLFQLPQLRELSLAGNFLRELPVPLFEMKYLEKLNISDNQIAALPEDIGKLKALRQLKTGNNPLSKLPPQLFQCRKLEELALTGNRLTKIPGAIGQLTLLENLDLSNNELAALPVEISCCQQLRRLNLNRNKLTKLPEFDRPFKYLIQFDAGYNFLNRLPDWIQQCTRVENINLTGNRLRSLPGFLSALPRLTKLDAAGNILRKWPALPDTLTTLNLSNNPIASIPNDIGHLTKLETLHLDQTKLSRLPAQFKFLRALETLSAKDVLLQAPPKSLFYMHHIQRMDGLLPPKEAEIVRLLWKTVRKIPQSGKLLPLLYQVAKGRKEVLSKVSVRALLLLHQHEDLEFLIRNELFRRSREQPEQALQAGKVLYCAGATAFDLATLAARVEKQGIRLVNWPGVDTTHVLLGKHPEFSPALSKRTLIFINELVLSQFLDHAEQRPLALNPTPEVIANLRQLLFHKEPTNIEIALRMMEAGGVPKALLNELLVLCFARHAGLPEALSKMAEGLLKLNVGEKEQQGLFGMRDAAMLFGTPELGRENVGIGGLDIMLAGSAFDAASIDAGFKEYLNNR
ncbi:MAG: leucine-rich repeat domain-containing protein [Saprospiraceae bacterium]|nr:leucine-rich repeat domain-containing protein [Saprospiraceae bacterium]